MNRISRNTKCTGYTKSALFVLTVAMLAVGGTAQADFIFDGGPDGTGQEVLTAANWDPDGVPDNANPGTIPAGFSVTYRSSSALDNKTLTLNGDASLDDAGAGSTRWDNSTITLNDTSHLEVTEYGLIVGRDAGGVATLHINDDATVLTKNFQLGRVSPGIVNQTGGYVTATAYLWLDTYTSTGNRYNLSGGTILTEILKKGNDTDSWFNFTAGSTGELIVLGSGADYTPTLHSLIDTGWIRIDDTASTPGDYSGFVIDYDGAQTTVQIPEPATLLLLITGVVGLLPLLRRSRKAQPVE